MTAFARVVLLVASTLGPLLAAGQYFDVDPPSDADAPSLPAAVHDLAGRVLPVYQEDDPDLYLSNLAALQMTIGDAATAHETRLRLRERLESEQSNLPSGRATVYDIYVQARAIESEAPQEVSFTSAYGRAFRETVNGFDDLDAYELEGWLAAPIEPRQRALQRALDERRGQTSIPLATALELVQTCFAYDAYRSVDDLAPPLLAEEIERRYVV